MPSCRPAARKILALALSSSLILPGFARAAGETSGAHPEAAKGIHMLQGLGIKPIGDLGFSVKIPETQLRQVEESEASQQMELPVLVPAPALKAPLSAPQAVARHPVFEALNMLRAKGVSLDADPTRADAAKIAAAAEALPEGSVRRSLLAMAQVISHSAGGGGATQAVLDKAFENAASNTGGAVGAGLPGGPPLKGVPSLGKDSARKAPLDPRSVEVPLSGLRWSPPADQLPASTRDIAPGNKQIVGQDDALKAIHFALQMPGENYNLFVSGPKGSGRESALRHILGEIASKKPVPPDLVAVTNFESKKDPIMLELPSGAGPLLEEAVEEFARAYQKDLPQRLGSSEMRKKKKALEEESQQAAQARLERWKAEVAQVRIGKFGIEIVPVKAQDGLKLIPIPTYEENGRMRTAESKEEIEEKIKQGLFTREEWQKAIADAQEKGKPFGEKFEEILDQNARERSEFRKKEEGLEAKEAFDTVSDLAGMLVEAVSAARHESPAEKKWREGAAKRLEAFKAEAAKVRVKGYGIIVDESALSEGSFTVTHEVDGRMQTMTPEELQAKISAGKISKEDLIKAAMPWIEKLQALFDKFDEEHKALHASDPPPSPAEVKALEYVQSLLQHAADHYRDFLPVEASQEGKTVPQRPKGDPADGYQVSVLVSNGDQKGAPVIWEASPTYERLFGSAEDNAQMMLVPGVGAVKSKSPGGPILKAGSFLKANGGFLVLDAMEVLKSEGVWPALMKAIRNGKAEIAEGGAMSLVREGDTYHVPAKVKVVLIGSPMIRMLLSLYDEDFTHNFSASPAEFAPALKIGAKAIAGCIQIVKSWVLKSAGGILDHSRDALAALFEFYARLAGSNQKLSAQVGAGYALAREATQHAKAAGRKEVRREDYKAALDARLRSDVYHKEFLELFKDRVFVVETEGQKVGQINGLAVMGEFGTAMRVTAMAVSRQRGEPVLVSIDRDAAMTGTSFNKALGVVESFIRQALEIEGPFPAQLRISFEQQYGGIDGDSATSTIIYGSLSALSTLAGVPIKQIYAVTGSADQFGNVQAIGGVNEKIEGFFDLAAHRGLRGDQGVIIPRTNVADLMLKPEVVQAAREGKWHIYAVDHVSQGIEILTGVSYRKIVTLAKVRLREMRARSILSRLFWRMVDKALRLLWGIHGPRPAVDGEIPMVTTLASPQNGPSPAKDSPGAPKKSPTDK